jgi:hypothetical protein
MKRFRIKLTSGEHAERYVGQSLGGGLVANPEAFVKLRALGHELEMIEVKKP